MGGLPHEARKLCPLHLGKLMPHKLYIFIYLYERACILHHLAYDPNAQQMAAGARAQAWCLSQGVLRVCQGASYLSQYCCINGTLESEAGLGIEYRHCNMRHGHPNHFKHLGQVPAHTEGV